MARLMRLSSPSILQMTLLLRAKEVSPMSWSSPSILEMVLLFSHRATKL